ncbi:hypothetical protein B0J11DRAFT_619735 [Dendryphion nanum]|uniref:Uncharacterized protein n=1 Tax=Dendryphion nanum TaxID=256645 RepID=A0A9P9D3Q2_9PLEO|nr:hypothetical protein B0J11DRAFT_619735 [Dendryphion nanum]
MRSLTSLSCLLAALSHTAQAYKPHGIGGIVQNGNTTEIQAWVAAGLAYPIINALGTHSPSLKYLCSNFDSLTTRFAALSPADDILWISKQAICDGANTPDDWNSRNQRNWMSLFTSGIFGLTALAGTNKDKEDYASMCYYIEETLLRGMWMPYRDDDWMLTDVESSFCVLAGYYGTGPGWEYLEKTVRPPAAIQQKVTTLLSRFQARALQVVIREQGWVEYICGGFGTFALGLKGMGLDAEAIEDVLCKSGDKVVGIETAVKNLKDIRTELFIVQLMNAGTDESYYAYMCDWLQIKGFDKIGIDGKAVLTEACIRARPGVGRRLRVGRRSE